MVLEIHRLAGAPGIAGTNQICSDLLVQSNQLQEGYVPGFSEVWNARTRIDEYPTCSDQESCRPRPHQMYDWKNSYKAKPDSVRGLVLSRNVIISHQVATLMSSSFGWKMEVVETDKQAYDLILKGNMGAVVADIDGIDLGGLALLTYSKSHWPSTRTFAITEDTDVNIKQLARDMGGCEGYFYLKKERIELDTQIGLGARLASRLIKKGHSGIHYVSALK